MIEKIENIELHFLTINDYQELKHTMIEAYSNMPNSYWKEKHIQFLIDKFPEGQIVIKVNDQLAGCALAIIIDYDESDNAVYVVASVGRQNFWKGALVWKNKEYNCIVEFPLFD